MTASQKIRILIVDDSLVMRRLIIESLSKDTDIEVAGQASSGEAACEKAAQLKPDLITMDVEMPGMSGIAALKEIRKVSPKVPVIMFSSLTKKGAVTVLEALCAGANDYATKPLEAGQALAAVESISAELIPKIKALCQRSRLVLPERKAVAAAAPAAIKPSSVKNPTAITFLYPIQILCIGTSTGGPNALTDYFQGISATFPVPIVIVQHMPPVFTKTLAERLEKESRLKFFEGEEGMELQAGVAYIAPGGKHMEIERHSKGAVIHLHEGPPENSCRPAVDVLFRSVAKCYGGTAMGVIMTGMGRDGAAGCQLIHKAGGKILAQNQETSVVWGMPGAVVEMELAHATLPLSDLAATTEKWIADSRRK